MKDSYKYIIIGAGIGGLHIGALLSQHGEVLVVEKTKNVGGRARVVEIDGFKLDLGPHPLRFGPESALGKSLRQLNKPIDFIKIKTNWAFLDNGIKTIFPSGGIMGIMKSKMVPTLKTLKFMIRIKKMSLQEFRGLYDLSLEDWFQKEQISPEIRKFLIMVSSSMQVNPYPKRSSAGELLHNIHRVLEIGSIFYPRGGWNSLFNSFIDTIKKNNGEISLNKKVSKIIIEDSKAKGIIADQRIINGEYIISTIPIQQIFSILDENLCKKDFVEKCKNLRPTAGVSIDFCLSQPISNIKGIIFFDKPYAFGFIPSNLSPEIVPKGHSLMTFFTPSNVEDVKDKVEMAKLHQNLRDTVLKFFPNIEDHLLHERPLFFEIVDGVEVNTEQHQFKRPGNLIEGIKNLYITGDSVAGEGAGGDIGHTSVLDCYNIIKKS